MYRSICAVVVVLAALAFTSGTKPAGASPTTPGGPITVAHGKLVNQTTPIPATTIFTPMQTGLYRLSVYMTMTKADVNSQSEWGFNLDWTDDAGDQAGNYLLVGFGPVSGQFYVYQSFYAGGMSMPFEAQAGTPITYTVVQNGGPDNSAYSLYYTLERLE